MARFGREERGGIKRQTEERGEKEERGRGSVILEKYRKREMGLGFWSLIRTANCKIMP